MFDSQIPPEFTTDIVILAIAGTIPQHPMEFRYDQGRNYATLDMFNKALEVARKIVQQVSLAERSFVFLR